MESSNIFTYVRVAAFIIYQQRTIDMMTVLEFLESKKESFADRGTMFMVPLIETWIQSNKSSFEDLFDEYMNKRSKHERFSIDFMYNWSIMTYIKSLSDAYQRQEYHTGPEK